MTSLLECNARAALCRQLARLEPASQSLWLAEAERWSHFTREPGAAAATRHGENAESWCWLVKPKPKPVDAELAKMRFEFANVACANVLEVHLDDVPFEASEAN